MKTTLRKFYKSNSGNITILSAILIPTLLTLGLGVVEYNVALEKKIAMEDAADLAAVNAIHEAHIAYTSNKNLDLSDLITETATVTFNDNVQKIRGISDHTVNVISTVEGNIFKVDVDFTGKYDAVLAQLIGKETLSFDGNASAEISASAYVNVTLLFDISSSMSIVADKAGQDTLYASTQCAFACHFDRYWIRNKNKVTEKIYYNGVPAEFEDKAREENFEHRDIITNDGSPGKAYFPPEDYSDYELARFLGLSTRLDVAKEAAIDAISELSDQGLAEDQVTFNVASFDNYLTPVVENDDPNAGDFEYIQDQIANGIKFNHWYGGSNPHLGITTLLNDLPTSGSGRTPEERLQYIVILSDGVQNTRMNTPKNYNYSVDNKYGSINRRQPHNESSLGQYQRKLGTTQIASTFSQNTCDAMEEGNVKPLFLLTNYIVPEVHSDETHFSWLKSILPDVKGELVKCAGKDAVIATDTPEEIHEAFKELFAVLASPLRLN